MMEKNQGRKRLPLGRITSGVQPCSQIPAAVEMRDGEQPQSPQLSSALGMSKRVRPACLHPQQEEKRLQREGGHFIGSLSHMFDVSVTLFFSEAPIQSARNDGEMGT